MNKLYLKLLFVALLFTSVALFPGISVKAAPVTVGSTGTYPNMAAALPFLSDGSTVIFVSNVTDNTAIYIDKNISINGMGYAWLLSAGVYLLDRPLHPTNVSIMNVTMLAQGNVQNMIYSNASDVYLSSINAGRDTPKSSNSYGNFLRIDNYGWDVSLYGDDLFIVDPANGDISVFANGTSVTSIYLNNVNASNDDSLYSWLRPDFFSVDLYDDALFIVSLEGLILNNFDDALYMTSYDNSAWLISVNDVVIGPDGLHDDMFDIDAFGTFGYLYAGNVNVSTADDFFNLYDESTDSTTLMFENIWIDQVDWDVFDISVYSPSFSISATGIYGDYIGDEAFTIYAYGPSYLGIFAQDLIFDYIDEELLYLSAWNINETIVDFRDFSVLDEVDDDETFDINVEGNYTSMTFTDFFLNDNDDTDVFDFYVETGIQSSFTLERGSIIDGDDEGIEMYLYGSGLVDILIEDVYIGFVDHYSIWIANSFFNPSNVSMNILYSYFEKPVHIDNQMDVSFFETFFYESSTTLHGDPDVQVFWTLGVRIVSELTGLPASGVTVEIYNESGLMGTAVTGSDGLALIPLSYKINSTYFGVDNLVIKTIFKNYNETFVYGLPNTLPSWVDDYLLRLPILVIDIDGTSSSGVFSLNLKGKRGTIRVYTFMNLMSGDSRYVEYNIEIQNVTMGNDVFIVNILIELPGGGRTVWYPALMIVDFNTNTISVLGPINFLVKL